MKSNDEDDYKPYLLISENKGSSWRSISDGLPDDRVNCLLEDPLLPDLLYIGSDRGVFASPDRGRTWTAISRGMPTASVQKLAWFEENDYLLAATHGRSLFMGFIAPVRKYYKSVDPKVESLLGIQQGTLPGKKDFPGDWDWNRHFPATFYWYQPVGGLMGISIEDASAKEIFAGKYTATAGINIWEWDLILGRKEDTGLYPIPEYKFPAPGMYQLTIQGQGIIIRTGFEVR
jgi:hypothetical protein